MDKYRNKDINDYMDVLTDCLTAIIGKEFGNLQVAKVMADNREENPEMTIEEATMLAIRNKAREIMLKTHTLATAMDRLTVMVRQMADHMENEKEARLYLNRLTVLTDFASVEKQLDDGIQRAVKYDISDRKTEKTV